MPYYFSINPSKGLDPSFSASWLFESEASISENQQECEEKLYKPGSSILPPRGWALINHGLLTVSSPSVRKSRWEKEETRQRERDRDLQRVKSRRVNIKMKTEKEKERWNPKYGCSTTESRIKPGMHIFVTTSLAFSTHVVCHSTRSVPCQPKTLLWLVNRQHTPP